jgi:hypothetical protein
MRTRTQAGSKISHWMCVTGEGGGQCITGQQAGAGGWPLLCSMSVLTPSYQT